jgi:hypothetical protein
MVDLRFLKVYDRRLVVVVIWVMSVLHALVGVNMVLGVSVNADVVSQPSRG